MAGRRRWDPRFLSSLYAWYRADSVISAASLVSQYTDISGNGRHLLQATGALQPTLTAVGIGGQPTVTFPGGKYLTCAAAQWGTLAQPCAYILVGSADQTRGEVFFEVSAGVPPRQGATVSTTQIQLYASTLIAANANTTAPSILAWLYNFGACKILQNNSVTALVTGNGGTQSQPNLQLGASGGGGTLIGTVSELIVCSTLPTATELAETFGYAATRYAINGVQTN